MDRDFAIRTMPLGYDLLDHIIRLSFTFSTGAVQGCSCRLSSRSLSLYLPFSLSLSSRGEDVPRVHGRPDYRFASLTSTRSRSIGVAIAGQIHCGEMSKKGDLGYDLEKKSRFECKKEEGNFAASRSALFDRSTTRCVLPRIFPFDFSLLYSDVSIILSITTAEISIIFAAT